MKDDELIERLRRTVPHPDASVDPTEGPRAARLLEQIMSTPVLDHDSTTVASRPPRRARRRWALLAGGGVAAVAIAVGAVALTGNDAAPTSVAYSLTPSNPATAMCLPVTDFVPQPGLIGFAGTVTAVTPEKVTLDVSKWYAGGDADRVELDITDVAIPALDGVEFVQGGSYLVAVADGQVLTCGISGPDEPVLAGLYASWFSS